DPLDGSQEAQPDEEGEPEAELAGFRLLIRGKLPRQDGDEDDVVDAQDDFHEAERDEAHQGFRGQEGVHVGGSPRRWAKYRKAFRGLAIAGDEEYRHRDRCPTVTIM